MTPLTIALASIGLWLWLGYKLRYMMRDYSYKYEYKGTYSTYKYKIIVYYNGDIIYTDDMQTTAYFGYLKMVIQALSHKRREGMEHV